MSTSGRFEGPEDRGVRTALPLAGLAVGLAIAPLAIPYAAIRTSQRLASQLGVH